MRTIFLTLLFLLLFFKDATRTNNGSEVFLRQFITVLKENNAKTVWTLVLNKGTSYRFRLYENGVGADVLNNKRTPEQNIVMQLYDAYNAENINPYGIANKDSNFAFDFVCEESAMYYLSISYADTCLLNKINALGILYFLGKNE